MNNIYNKIILYDDKNLMYCTGSLYNAEINQEYKTCSSITGERWTVPLSQTFQGTDVKEAVYQANQEAINSTKLKLRILENQLNREYNNTGRSNI